MLDLLLTKAISNLNANANDTDTDTPDDMPIGHKTHDKNAQLNSLTDKSEPSIPPTTPMLSSPSMSSPLYLSGGMDNDNSCDSPWSFTNPHTPSLSHQNKDSHCCMNLLFNDDHPSDHHLQPHESMCNSNTNNNNKQHTMTTIYTQNARGLWWRPRDDDANILVDAPPDLMKLEYIIDHMQAHDVGAWLLQET